jgi:hypothetical protein
MDFGVALWCIGIFVSVGVFLAGSAALVEDWEVRRHSGGGPLVNPFCATLGLAGGLFFILSAVTFLRILWFAYLRLIA